MAAAAEPVTAPITLAAANQAPGAITPTPRSTLPAPATTPAETAPAASANPTRPAQPTKPASTERPAPTTATAPAKATAAPAQSTAATIPPPATSATSATPATLASPAPALKLEGELASLPRIVPFAVSTARLGPKGRQALAEIVPLAKQAQRVNVRGRTDTSGDKAKNRQLAQARASQVMYAFIAEGVARKVLKASYCTRCFVASNDTAEGRRANRRVDVEVVMPAKLALNLPRPIHSAPDALDTGRIPALLARLDTQFTPTPRRN